MIRLDRAHATLHATVDLVILTIRSGQLHVLLVERGNDPHQGRLALPGGFLRHGEDLQDTARRELAEETDWAAGRFDLLLDLQTSPGFSDETIRVFLARDLTPVPEDERHERQDEEADLEIAWFELDEAVAMILRGEITNASTVAGLLAAARTRDEGWATLRPA